MLWRWLKYIASVQCEPWRINGVFVIQGFNRSCLPFVIKYVTLLFLGNNGGAQQEGKTCSTLTQQIRKINVFILFCMASPWAYFNVPNMVICVSCFAWVTTNTIAFVFSQASFECSFSIELHIQKPNMIQAFLDYRFQAELSKYLNKTNQACDQVQGF